MSGDIFGGHNGEWGWRAPLVYLCLEAMEEASRDPKHLGSPENPWTSKSIMQKEAEKPRASPSWGASVSSGQWLSNSFPLHPQ